MVRVLPDVAAIDRCFDYLVPDEMSDQVRVGTIVRVALHGRRVRGWVVEDDVTPAPGVRLQPLAKVTGWGPPTGIMDLAGWAAWRWAGPRATFLRAASPRRRVVSLMGAPPPPPSLRSGQGGSFPCEPPAASGGGGTNHNQRLVGEAFASERSVLRLPPDADPFVFVSAAASLGDALVLTPSAAQAAHLLRRLRREGRAAAAWPDDWARAAAGGVVVVGGRGAAWAPVPTLAAVVAIDVHDEAYQEERTPSWNGWHVAAERARRDGVPCVALSPCPTLESLRWGRLLTASRARERAGWPSIDVVDRRNDDPRSGLYSERLVKLVRSGRRVACILNRKGRARLLACAACGGLARCERCGAAAEQLGEGLRCRACGLERPSLCAVCGSQRLKVLRAGVSRVVEELEALVGASVGEITGQTTATPDTPVVVGTEAALHRLDELDAVAFLDFDQELLVPRFRASEQALALLARAARVVGGRRGNILVQTRVPDHEVLEAAVHADPGRLTIGELARREALGLPPYTVLAEVSGPDAPTMVASLPSSVERMGPDGDRWLVRAPDHSILCDALASVARPRGRVRVVVDPARS